jgi:hypothetical protein
MAAKTITKPSQFQTNSQTPNLEVPNGSVLSQKANKRKEIKKKKENRIYSFF